MSSSEFSENPRRPVWSEIDRSALVHNLSVVRSLIPPKVRIMAIVKADAYGHGAVDCARALRDAGAELLGVALLQEAMELRRVGIEGPILVLTPPMPEEADAYVGNNIAFTLVRRETAAVFSDRAAALGSRAIAHLKIDTGMGRVGITPSDAPSFLAEVSSYFALRVEGIATHFASSDDDLPLTQQQWDRFMMIVATLRSAGYEFDYVHASNSGAIMHLPAAAGTCVRPGLMLYGYAPGVDHPLASRLRPVLSLRAKVDFVKRVPAGTGISYGWRYTTTSASTIATVPLGYADGYSRRLTGKAFALMRGHRVPVAGTICMDQIMLNVGDLAVSEGDVVTLIGAEERECITAWDLASATGTIPYEILTSISKRVPRIYI